VDADQRIDPDCMDIEHALSWAALGALHRVPRPPVSPDAPLVLLACVEAEHHTLPLAALSAALAGHRIPTRMLGAATPTPSLVRAVRDTVPGAVVVWAQRPDTAGPEVVRALRPYSVRLYTAGPGWPVPPPPGVRHLGSLREAVDTLAAPPAGTAPPAGNAPSGIASVLPAGTLPPSGPVRSLQ
jgi:MerR family transcriptional regulator, light-induced transcriptional regulator